MVRLVKLFTRTEIPHPPGCWSYIRILSG